MPRPDSNKKKQVNTLQRQRRIRKQLRQKHARYTKVLNRLSHPAAAVTLATGDVPDHLQMPVTMRGVRRLVREMDALYHYFTSDDVSAQGQPDDGVTPEPEIPKLLRSTAKRFVAEDGDFSGLVRLPSGHIFSPGDLVSWHSQGELRVPYYLETNSKSPLPGKGWALIYDSELQMILPGLNLKWNRRRTTYWVRLVRDDEGHASEIRVHSESLKPLFRLAIEVQDPALVMDADLAAWWTGANR